MKKILYIATALGLMFTSCSKESGFENPTSGDGAVQFMASAPTRVTEDSEWQADDQIGVFAGSVSNTEYKIKADNSGVMEYVSGTEIYAPSSGTQNYYAYYPYDANIEGSKLSVDLTTNQLPLVWAEPEDKSGSSVTFDFKHQLVKLNLTFTAGGADIANLDGATAMLKGANSKGEFDVATGVWSSSETEAVDLPLTIATTETSTTLTIYVMPTTSPNTTTTIEINADGKSFVWQPTTTAWEIGNSYDYNVSVGDVPAPKVGDYYYKDGTYSTENSATADNPVIGVVFWVGNPTNPSANGSGLTFLGDATLADDHSNCTNGLVVALNDVEENALVWQSSYMDVETWRQTSSLSSSTFSVSTNGATNGETLNRIGGYNNSKVIAAFNAENANNKVSAYEKVETYALSNPTPASSSGWYLPSLKELFLLCGTDNPNDISMSSSYSGTDNRDAINTVLNSVSGASEIKTSYYWPSTELNYEITCVMVFSDGSNGASTKGSTYRIRPVLAF